MNQKLCDKCKREINQGVEYYEVRKVIKKKKKLEAEICIQCYSGLKAPSKLGNIFNEMIR